MGFKRPNLRLEFADPQFDGFEVLMRRLSTRRAMELEALLNQPRENAEDSQLFVKTGVEFLAHGIISWNLEDDEDQPIEPTGDNLLDVDQALLHAILRAWLQVSVSIPPPLAGDSDSGDQSLAESLPMES
jgi:hypothetical protein